MRLPTNLGKCPIIEAFIEIHFKSEMVADAVFGLVYGALKVDFPTVTKLPIAQIPDEIRKANVELRRKPCYQLRGADSRFLIQVGPDVLTINNIDNYLGWKDFQKFYKNVWEKITKVNVITEIERVGVHYINFFKQNVFENTKLKIKLIERELGSEETFLRSCLTEGDYQKNINITNRAMIKRPSGTALGSVIDIEAACSDKMVSSVSQLPENIEKTRLVVKSLFFDLLNKDFLESLEPNYED
jgi:uncharacterized protein (TIGR04255 family)